MKQLSGCECMIAKNKITDPSTGYFERLSFFLFILSFYSFEKLRLSALLMKIQSLENTLKFYWYQIWL